MFENLPKLNGKAIVELTIDGSSMQIELNGDDAPITAGNFVDLVEKGVYDGVAFHRVLEGFVAQGGDPNSQNPNFPIEFLGTSGYIDPDTGEERTIPLEIKLEGDEEPTYSTQLGRLGGNSNPNVVLPHDRGVIAMARSTPPDSASSQFYLTLEEVPFLNGDYAVFGEIIEGIEVLDEIERIDPQSLTGDEVPSRISNAEVISGAENLNAIDLFRFRNASFNTGTYLFVGEAERDSIQANSDLNETFALEGNGNTAFKAATRTGDDLLPFYRLRSLETEGTYLVVSDAEYDVIFAEDSNQRDKWFKEGLDAAGEDIPEFYLYGADAGKGIAFNRFQNLENNTFLYAGPQETEAILADPNLSANFINQGVAFESLL